MWILITILAATFAAFRFFYARGVGQSAAETRLGGRATKICARYRRVALLALAVHLAAFFGAIGQPSSVGWLNAYQWGGALWLVLGIVIAPFGLYHLLAGIWAAGRGSLSADGSPGLFRGIYRDLRHPQFLGGFLLLLSVALIARSPLLTLVALMWLWQFLVLMRIEDVDLEGRFGRAYEEYRAGTGAFITLKEPPRPRPLANCPNCGETLAGAFCHRCGQRGVEVNRSLAVLIGDYLRHELRRNPRFLRTLLPLLLKPGFLPYEFLAGRRVRYLSPLRTYLAASILAFFLLALAGQRIKPGDLPAARNSVEADETGVRQELAQGLRQRPSDGEQGLERKPSSLGNRDSLITSILREELLGDTTATVMKRSGANGEKKPVSTGGPSIRIGWVSIGLGDSAVSKGGAGADTAGFWGRFNRSVQRGWNRARRDPGRLAETAVRKLTQAMFVLMPLFALMLKALYLRHRRYYLQHLVFALHFHATAFLVVAIITAVNLWAPAPAAMYGNLLAWMVPLHLFLGMKRFYGQGWAKTAMKFLLASSAYLAAVAAALTLAFLLSLASL